MDLNPYLDTLRENLASTASAGDEQLQRAAAVLSAALEPAARLALMNALSDLAAEVTAELPGHVVDVRLDGRDLRVVVDTVTPAHPADTADSSAVGSTGSVGVGVPGTPGTPESGTAEPPGSGGPTGPAGAGGDSGRTSGAASGQASPGDTGDVSRMTLRLFEQLKHQAEQAASAQGVSLNTFVSQAVQGALRGQAPGGGSAGPRGTPGHRGPGGGRGGASVHGWVRG